MNISSFKSNPAAIIASSFLGLILLGAFLLRLPISLAPGETLSWLDSFFMAVSATCVTGLSVIDIGHDLTFFGQMVILVLIQIGGLGIMTFSLFFFLALGIQTSITSRLALSGYSKETDMRNLFGALGFVFLMAVSLELIGAACLFYRWKDFYPLGEAAYLSLFHAVSAFCNAGFSLFSDSLMAFSHDPWILFPIMALIVLGGLGFLVIDEVREWLQSRFRKKRRRLSLHSRICLIGTLIFIIGGTGVIWLLEFRNVLSGGPGLEGAMNSLFLSVTSRTAGFNSVETSYLSNSTLFFLVLMMFIGGCPGSTTGGIKLTSFFVLIALIRSQIKGRHSTSLMKRTLPQPIIAKALGIFAASFLLVNLATLGLQATETIGLSHQMVKGRFLDLLFEAASAFGTVGLSTGVTADLTSPGKVLVCLLMFAGRLGPLTLGLAIISRVRKDERFEYAEEEVLVG